MDIYQPQNLSEKTIKNFRPTRLLIKELAGQYYFCKSVVQDVIAYPGSGVIWSNRIKKYGKKNIKTLWISDWYYDANLIQEVALHFSRENQIVESKMWANMRPENGINGGAQIGEANPHYKPEKILWYNNETNETHYWTRKEFYTNTYTSSEGIALLLGVNRVGNRQLWIADSAT